MDQNALTDEITPMLHIDALPAFSDNYIWLLQDVPARRCAVVDPGDATPVLEWLSAHPDWQLEAILVTHHHQDHVGGVAALRQATGARVYGPAHEKIPAIDQPLEDGQRITVLGLELHILHVPGHTLGHIAYYGAAQNLLFCGDTLFAAGCGRLFEGTPAQMHASLQRLAALPGQTAVYCTHEYTLSNLRFAQAAEPENAEIAARLAEVGAWREQGRISLPSRIDLELRTNPFLRSDDPSVRSRLRQPEDTAEPDALETFTRLRRWKDSF